MEEEHLEAEDEMPREINGWRERYYDHAVRNTCCHNLCCWATIIVMTMTVLAVYPFLYPGDGSQADFVDPSAIAKIDFDGKAYAQELYLSVVPEPTQQTAFSFVYDSKDGSNVFTPANVKIMCEIEAFVFAESNLTVDCDVTDSNSTCVSQRSSTLLTGTSIASIFYAYDPSDLLTSWSIANGTFGYHLPVTGGAPLGFAGYKPEDCTLLPQANIDYVLGELDAGIASGGVPAQLFGFFMDATYETLGYSTAARSIISISVPTGDDSAAAQEELAAINLRIQDELFTYLGMAPGFLKSVYRADAQRGDLDVLFFEAGLIGSEFSNLISTDFLMVFGSMTFVFFWMWTYTRSIIVTVPCVLCIFLSITVALFVYKLIFRIEYFDFIHILAVFLILGIGADDVFVVFDAWNQSQFHHTDEYERFKYTVNRATQSVFNTSFTTAVAFTVTGITPLVPISTFGIFAALTIIVCFVYTFTIFPTTVLLWHRWVQRRKGPKMPKDPSIRQLSVSELEHKLQTTKIKLKDLVNGKNRFLKRFYIPFVEKYDKYIVVFGFILGCLGIAGVTQASPLTKAEEFLPTDHMLQIFADTFGTKWLSGSESEFVSLDVYWGVKDIERNFLGWYTGNSSRYGDVVIYDPDFDLSDYAAQQTLSGMCAALAAATCSDVGCQPFGTILLPASFAPPSCTIDTFHTWWQATFLNTDYDITPKNDAQKEDFFTKLEQFAAAGNQDFVGFYEGELIYFGMQFRMTLTPFVPASVKAPVENRLRTLFEDYNADAPATAKNARFSSQEFVQNAVEAALVSTVVRGLAVTFPIVFLVLLVATNNYLLAVFSCVSIAFIVVDVLGIVFAIIGWELGIAESIVAIMIVGLSVDYTVHLGHMYTFAGTHEGFQTRGERFEYAVLTMGTTVLAGATTTMGAGLFLFGAQILFFTKMAILLTLTVTFSVYYSFFFMMALSSWIGPEGDYATFRKSRNKGVPSYSEELDTKA